MRPSVWVLGIATVLFVMLVVAVLAGSLLAKSSPSSDTQAFHASEITSDEAVGMVKQWVASGTQVGAVQDVLGNLICTGYYDARGTWEVRCRLPWVPAEGYVFSLTEESGEVTAETEATVEFVRLLRQWGHVPQP